MIITLCGSTKFKPYFREHEKSLTLDGHIVLSCNVFSHYDGDQLTDSQIDTLYHVHLQKIEMADRIHILNVGGYIGDGLMKEISYARRLGKDITYLEAPIIIPN